jgi:predicted DNA-binding protein with PD1-like motif
VSSLVVFNTVERLLRGDFFHTVGVADVCGELGTFPSDWLVVGLGTTNWFDRHGELLVEGTAATPRFWWADPEGTPAAALIEVPKSGEAARLPFVAVAVIDPSSTPHEWQLAEGDAVHDAIAEAASAANMGLAALRVTGAITDVAYQVMCHIPIGGIAEDRPARADEHHAEGQQWEAVGLYAANPTIQSVVSHGVAAVHLHARVGDPARGGHVNRATASATTSVVAWPIHELVLRIRDLDVAIRPTR